MKKDLIVVGIGSSAGGLEALQILLGNLPDIPNCAYIIAQHLSPTHKSMMVELLNRVTNIPVIEVKNGMVIKSKTIYMTPENTDIFVDKGKMYLKHIEQSFGPRPSVNYFFNSLAKEFHHRAIGIILSGTGSDGAFGIRAIKAEGGITLAQSPTTAKYDGMPLSAINTGKVDLVVSIDNLSAEIASIANKLESDISISTNEFTAQQIFRILFEEYGVDFSLYKKSTIARRIERRIAALKLDSISDYYDIFKENKEEISNLYHDILIGVTGFFRDKEAFDVIRMQIEHLVSKKEQGEEIRFWSIGCSTGEEAYSIAIILSEILQEKIDKYKIKIFATDIDDEALKMARAGVYSDTSLQGVDSQLIQRYFSVQKNQFEVKKKVRELVIFSKHNVVSDSPFLRLDLVSCRNMLIYFSQGLQNKFFPIIHYALNDNGILFLGKSESVGSNIDLFSLIDKNAKVFKSQYTGIKEPPKLYNYSTSMKPYNEPSLKRAKNDDEVFLEKIIEAIQNVVLDKCVVLNSSNDMIYVSGKIPYLNHADGRVSNNIFKLLESDLGLDLRGAINEANKTRKQQKTPFRAINVIDDIIKYVRITVVPILDDRKEEWFNILFFQSEDTQNIRGHIIADGNENDIIAKLTIELDSTKSHLQNVIEELETSYEEMQSLNEELQSSNEELQSSNEELETTNEELQSTNEELQTAYSELRVLYDDKDKRAKQLETLMEKLNHQTQDLRSEKDIKEAILDTTPVAVIMVDKNGVITYANKAAEKLLELTNSNVQGIRYDSLHWKIKDLDGNDFDEKELPFSVVKKTYAPVHNIQHTIHYRDTIKFLSVSGGPLFDHQGIFQGAVFSVEDMTASHALKEDVAFYKKSYSTDMMNSFDKDDLIKLFMIDLVSIFKNNLNQISLLTQTIHETNDMEIKNKIDEKIKLISNNLDEKVSLYGNKTVFDRVDVKGEVDYFIALFAPLFDQNSIKIEKNILFEKEIYFTRLQLKHIFYYIFEYILAIRHDYITLELFSIDMIVESSKQKGVKIILKTKEAIDTQKIVMDKFEQLKNSIDSTTTNLEIDLEKNIVLAITIVE